jgi:hypothetical protein
VSSVPLFAKPGAVSMVDGALFDKLVRFCLPLYSLSDIQEQEEIARMVRGNDAPFGGIQVLYFLCSRISLIRVVARFIRCVVTNLSRKTKAVNHNYQGDFFQLPPVPNRIGDKVITPTFAFDAKAWGPCIGHPVTLTRVFRQKDQGLYQISIFTLSLNIADHSFCEFVKRDAFWKNRKSRGLHGSCARSDV